MREATVEALREALKANIKLVGRGMPERWEVNEDEESSEYRTLYCGNHKNVTSADRVREITDKLLHNWLGPGVIERVEDVKR